MLPPLPPPEDGSADDAATPTTATTKPVSHLVGPRPPASYSLSTRPRYHLFNRSPFKRFNLFRVGPCLSQIDVTAPPGAAAAVPHATSPKSAKTPMTPMTPSRMLASASASLSAISPRNLLKVVFGKAKQQWANIWLWHFTHQVPEQ